MSNEGQIWGTPRIEVEHITKDHEDYQEFQDFDEADCQVCATRYHEELFKITFIDYGADILFCKSCLNELRGLISALNVLLTTGKDTKCT
jgi:hypothetical protein